jgi:hypothetical protein
MKQQRIIPGVAAKSMKAPQKTHPCVCRRDAFDNCGILSQCLNHRGMGLQARLQSHDDAIFHSRLNPPNNKSSSGEGYQENRLR